MIPILEDNGFVCKNRERGVWVNKEYRFIAYVSYIYNSTSYDRELICISDVDENKMTKVVNNKELLKSEISKLKRSKKIKGLLN